MREKLIELLSEINVEMPISTTEYLIAGGVTIPVHCKDCKHYKTIQCSCSCTVVSSEWYCADGERKDNG